jgi:lipoate-protein ligase A
MRIEDLSFEDPQQNLDRDDELLFLADKKNGGEVLRFWESSQVFVVLGRTCAQDADVHLQLCQQDSIPVLRRSSGGGTVIQGRGCFNFSLILAKGRHPDMASITRSYEYILKKTIKALGICGVDAEFRPICDLVLSQDEKKFSGNAQRRGRTHILHHGTILYGMDLSLISRYLKIPLAMPDYRRCRPHSDFITNVNLDISKFKAILATVWNAV